MPRRLKLYIIGVVAAGMTFIGLRLGCKMGVMFGRPMQLVGGLVLIGIGVRVLTTHLGIQIPLPF